MSDELLSVKAALNVVPFSERTLRGLLGEGKIPFVRISAGRIAILRSDLERYIASRRETADKRGAAVQSEAP